MALFGTEKGEIPFVPAAVPYIGEGCSGRLRADSGLSAQAVVGLLAGGLCTYCYQRRRGKPA